MGGRCPLRGLISFLMLLFCVGAALLAPAKPPARPPEARPLPGRRRQRGGRGGLPPAHPLPPFVPVPSSLRLVKARPRPGRRRQRGGRGGLPPAHSLSSSVLVENGWWLSSCLVVRPSASAQGAATQALQRRHSGALCRAKSIHGELAGVGMCMWLAAAAWLASMVPGLSASAQGAATQALQRRHSGALSRAKSAMCCCGGWLAVRRPGPGARSWELGLRPAPAPPPSPSPRARALGRYRSLSTPPNAAGGRKNL